MRLTSRFTCGAHASVSQVQAVFFMTTKMITQLSCFGDTSDDILYAANLAIGKINQTNPGVVRGIDSLPATNLDPGKRDLRLTGQR
jgi:hypothetical protein